MHFEVQEVQFSIDDSLAMAAFLGSDSHYLVLTRDLQPSEQDIGLGHDQVHVEFDDQLKSMYGGIASGSLGSSCLELVFDDQGSAEIGEASLSVSFSFPPERFCQLREVVRVLFEACETFAVDT